MGLQQAATFGDHHPKCLDLIHADPQIVDAATPPASDSNHIARAMRYEPWSLSRLSVVHRGDPTDGV